MLVNMQVYGGCTSRRQTKSDGTHVFPSASGPCYLLYRHGKPVQKLNHLLSQATFCLVTCHALLYAAGTTKLHVVNMHFSI